jgi:hypothetical protein
MCFTLAKILPHDRWNWDGDRIVHECIVPSSRPVPGYLLKKSSYDIDVREFLVTERNEVMRRNAQGRHQVIRPNHPWRELGAVSVPIGRLL